MSTKKSVKIEPAPPTAGKPSMKSARRVSIVAASVTEAPAQTATAPGMQRRKSTVKGQVDFSTDRDDVDEAYELIDTWMHFAAVGNLSAINAQLESNKYGQIKSTVSTLLKSKASSAKWDVNVQDRVCNTALLYAVWNGQVDAVKLLISHGADVKHQNESRTTAAHLAIVMAEQNVSQLNMYLDIVSALFKAGADAEIKNEHSETPLLLLTRSDVLQSTGAVAKFKQAMNLIAHPISSVAAAIAAEAEVALVRVPSETGLVRSHSSQSLRDAPATLTRTSSVQSMIMSVHSDGDDHETDTSTTHNAPLPPPMTEAEFLRHQTSLIQAYKAIYRAILKYGIDPEDSEYNSKSSYLSKTNLHAFFTACGLNITDMDTHMMFAVMDLDRDDCVDESDFLKMMLAFNPDTFAQSLNHAFKIIDVDNDGKATLGDLREAARRIGPIFGCATDQQILKTARSVTNSISKVNQVALSKRQIEWMAQPRLDYEALRQYESREASALAAFATERMRAFGGGTFGNSTRRGTSISGAGGSRRASMFAGGK